MSGIDWSLAQQPQSPLALQQANAAQTQNIQQQRALHALHGINVNDPASVQQGVNALTGLGMSDQASALTNLAQQRILNQANTPNIVALAQRFGQHLNQSSQDPNAGPQQGSPDMSPEQLGHAQQTMQLAADVVKEMQAAPDETHAQAVLTARTPDLLARGLPQAAIDSVTSHLQDKNFATEDLQGLLDHYQGHADNFGGMAQGQPRANGLTQHPADMYGPGTDISRSIVTDPFYMSPENIGYADKYLGVNMAPGVQNALSATAQQREAPFQMVAPVDSLGRQQQMSAASFAAGQAQPGAPPIAGPSTYETAQRTAAAGAPYTGVTTNTGPGGAAQTQSAEQFAAGRGAPQIGPEGQIGPAPSNAPPLTAPSPAAQQQFQASGVQLGSDLAAVSKSQPQMVALRKVIDLLPNTNVGPGVQVTNNWRSFVMSQLPAVAGLIPGGLTEAKVQTANTNELQKYMVQIAGAQAAQYGQGTNEKLAVAASGNPHITMDKTSALDVTRMAYALQRAQNATPFLFSTLHVDPSEYSGFASNYARTVDPRAFMLDLLSPADRGKMMATITTPQDKARFLRGVQAAEAAGYFQRADLPR